MAIQVFEISDCEWWAGEGTPQEILAHYMNETGCTHDEATGNFQDWPRALSDQEMQTIQFTVDENGKITRISFAEQLRRLVERGQHFPCLFASTEF